MTDLHPRVSQHIEQDIERFTLETEWNTDAIVKRRERFYAASQRAFVPYRTPLIFRRGQDQYLWDEQDNRYISLLNGVQFTSNPDQYRGVHGSERIL